MGVAFVMTPKLSHVSVERGSSSVAHERRGRGPTAVASEGSYERRMVELDTERKYPVPPRLLTERKLTRVVELQPLVEEGALP